MKQISWFALALLCLSGVAQSEEEFKCLEGAKDHVPYKPGNVVRWCEITKDGRLLYHGSVWRWYPSGQMEGKEFYVFGNADGVWPSWYENGKPSSLGSFKDGTKTGLWKYWDVSGWLKTEVTYAVTGNLWTEYYPSGQKQAVGSSVRSGKVGKWTYWGNDGTVNAECDFGNGLFTLPTKSCQIIADQLDPKGFSPPIPVVIVTPEAKVVVDLAAQSFSFLVPIGWVPDIEVGKKEQTPLVFYKQGDAWRGAGPNIYIRALFKHGATFDNFVKNEAKEFRKSVVEYSEKNSTSARLQNGRKSISKVISYKALQEIDSPFSIVSNNISHEKISFLDVSDQVVLMVVLTSHNEPQLIDASPSFMSLVKSFSDHSKQKKFL
jgi:hypothetical protein